MKSQDAHDMTAAKEGFSRIYAEEEAPWEIGKPQPPFVAIADQVKSPLLDAGCGSGNTAIHFAARGLEVTGIDFVEEALRRAREKASERGVAVTFLQKDAMTLASWDARFASVIDSGLFHIYHGEQRRTYVAGLAHVTQPGGRLYLFAFSDEEQRPERGTSEAELRALFADSWQVESIERARGELNPSFIRQHPDAFPDGYTKMWFAVARRK
jgi:ubiquinone/menaquinone biosynthesis C-methylase UbiE